jgi:hypothetical protein
LWMRFPEHGVPVTHHFEMLRLTGMVVQHRQLPPLFQRVGLYVNVAGRLRPEDDPEEEP